MAKRKQSAGNTAGERDTCGIVMPISAREECTAGHWQDVLEILTSAADMAGFEGRIVSSAEQIGVIHQTIVDNLFDNPIVVCDVSTENPNVMFELGLRLAFDKPTVVVVDDRTKIQFDTSPIEHLKYPRDLRFGSIVDFKEKLAEKLKATKEKHSDLNSSTFLRSFKRFTPAKIETAEVPNSELILKELESFKRTVTARLDFLSVQQRPETSRDAENGKMKSLKAFVRSKIRRGASHTVIEEILQQQYGLSSDVCRSLIAEQMPTGLFSQLEQS